MNECFRKVEPIADGRVRSVKIPASYEVRALNEHHTDHEAKVQKQERPYRLYSFPSLQTDPTAARANECDALCDNKASKLFHRSADANHCEYKAELNATPFSIHSIQQNTSNMPPKRVKKVMTVPINVIFGHLQVRSCGAEFWVLACEACN